MECSPRSVLNSTGPAWALWLDRSFSSGSVVSSLNRLPFKPSHRLEADAAAGRHRPKEFAGQPRPNRNGAESACRSIRVNMWSGSRPTSAANMQKDQAVDEVGDRLRVVAPFSQRLGGGPERRRHALGRVVCGRGRDPTLSRCPPRRRGPNIPVQESRTCSRNWPGPTYPVERHPAALASAGPRGLEPGHGAFPGSAPARTRPAPRRCRTRGGRPRLVVSISARWPASTRRPTPRADRSCTVLTKSARFRPSRSSFQTMSTSPFRKGSQTSVESRPVVVARWCTTPRVWGLDHQSLGRTAICTVYPCSCAGLAWVMALKPTGVPRRAPHGLWCVDLQML